MIQPGELALEDFCVREAMRCNVGLWAIYMRIRRGRYSSIVGRYGCRVKLRREPNRNVFVTVIPFAKEAA